MEDLKKWMLLVVGYMKMNKKISLIQDRLKMGFYNNEELISIRKLINKELRKIKNS